MTPETAALWLGAAGLVIGVVIVARLMTLDEPGGGNYGYLLIVPGFAAVSYAAMALGIGNVVVDGVPIPAPRYVDWLVTTPVLIGYAAYVAGASRQLIGGLVVIDVLMIVIGWGGVITNGPARLAAFVFSSLCYVGLLVALYTTLASSARDQSNERQRLYSVLQNHVGLLWLAYPVMWAAGPLGFGFVTIAEVTLLVTFADVAAKTPYVYFVYAHRQAFTDAGATADQQLTTARTASAD